MTMQELSPQYARQAEAVSRRLRELLAHLLREFAKDKQNGGVGLFADVNSNE